MGLGGAYALIASVYLVDIIVLLRLNNVKHVVSGVHESPVKSLVGGLRYVRRNETVLVLLLRPRVTVVVRGGKRHRDVLERERYRSRRVQLQLGE